MPPVDMPSGLLGPPAPGAGSALPPPMGPMPPTGETVVGRRRGAGQAAGHPRRHGKGVKRHSRGGRGRKAAKKY